MILQENLMLGVLSPDEYLASARQLDERVRAAGGETILLALWGSKYDARVTSDDQTRVSREIGERLGLRVVPLGQAWRLVRQANSEMRLYEAGSDGASVHGDYLNAAVLLAYLLDADPRASAYIPLDRSGKPEFAAGDAIFLRNIAWEIFHKSVDPQQ